MIGRTSYLEYLFETMVISNFNRCISGKGRKGSPVASLLFGLILIQAVSLQDADCPETDSRCTSCVKGYCQYCAYFQPPAKGGAKKECTDTRISIPNCLSQFNGEEKCLDCFKGYYLSNDLKSCIKGDIQNCDVYMSASDVSTVTDFNKVCLHCKEGFVNKDENRKECVAVDDSKKIAHCEYHDYSGSGNSYSCNGCMKGYSRNKNKSSDPAVCEEVSEGNEGCSIHEIMGGKQVCSNCRYFDHYYITKTGCKKIDPPAGISNSDSNSTSKFQERLSISAFWAVLLFSIWVI